MLELIAAIGLHNTYLIYGLDLGLLDNVTVQS